MEENADFMDPFNRVESQSIQDSINTLLDNVDLPTKTEINHPVSFTILQLIAKRCKKVGFVKSAKTLNFYLDHYRENMISYKRKSRKEFISALNSIRNIENPDLSGSEQLVEKIKEK